MIFTYMAGILSTVEKVFGLRSEYSAFVMSGNELSQILLILVLPCINQAQRRPLWVGSGTFKITSVLQPQFDVYFFLQLWWCQLLEPFSSVLPL